MLSFANVYFFGSGLFNELQPIQIKNSIRPSPPRELSWRRPIAPKPFLSGRRRELLHTGKDNTMFGFHKDIVAGSHSRKDCVRLQPEISALGSKLCRGLWGISRYRNNGPSWPPFAVFSLEEKVAVAANHQVIANSAGRTRQSRHRTQTRSAQPTRAGYSAASLKLAAAASGVRSRWGEPSISKPTMNFRIVAERRSGG
jgi:hypothetical protein